MLAWKWRYFNLVVKFHSNSPSYCYILHGAYNQNQYWPDNTFIFSNNITSTINWTGYRNRSGWCFGYVEVRRPTGFKRWNGEQHICARSLEVWCMPSNSFSGICLLLTITIIPYFIIIPCRTWHDFGNRGVWVKCVGALMRRCVGTLQI